jgi:hypothetical protein
LWRSSFEKHGAEHFVVALIRIGWLSEEVVARGVIHDPNSPEMSVGYWGGTGFNRKSEWRRRRYELARNRVKIGSAASYTTHQVTPEKGDGTENRPKTD